MELPSSCLTSVPMLVAYNVIVLLRLCFGLFIRNTVIDGSYRRSGLITSVKGNQVAKSHHTYSVYLHLNVKCIFFFFSFIRNV